MQIHELNNFTGTLGSGSYLAIDDGNDTGKLSTQQLLAATEARIDNIIAGPAPSAQEVTDARLGADGVVYPSLGDAIRDQVADLKSDLQQESDYQNNILSKVSDADVNFIPYANSALAFTNGYYNGTVVENAITTKEAIPIKDVWSTMYAFMSGVDFATYPSLNVKFYSFDSGGTLLDNINVLYDGVLTRNFSVNSQAKTFKVTVNTNDGDKHIKTSFLYDNGIKLYFGNQPLTTEAEFDALYEIGDTRPQQLKIMADEREQAADFYESLFNDLAYGKTENLVPRAINHFKNMDRNGNNAPHILIVDEFLPIEPSSKIYAYWSGVDFTKYPSIALTLYFYKEDGTYISGVNTLTSAYSTREVNTPTNAAKVKVAINTNDGEKHILSNFLYENGIRAYVGTKPISTDAQYDALYDVGSDVWTDIPAYWKSYIKTNIDTIKTLVETTDDTFFFITDVHVPDNQMWSPNIVRNIQKEIKIEKVICGGDYATSATTRRGALNQIDEWLEKCDADWMCIRGNHDDNSEGGTGEVTAKDFYSHAIHPLGNRVTLMAENTPTYYYDDEQSKIRYIFLDAINRQADADISNQVSWMQTRITELDNTWSVLVFAHMYWLNNNHDVTAVGQQIKSGIDAIYDSANASIIGFICGHTHNDYSVTTAKGYPIISTTCDAGGGNGAVDPDYPSRPVGTTNEQAFDIFGIDKENRTIKTVRIGQGLASRTFAYRPLSQNP